MDLKGLIQREIGEGVTEEELASAVGVSEQTIMNILADELPQDPAIWDTFARHFRMDVDSLRTGGQPYADGLFELTGSTHHSPVGEMRKVPLLKWDEIDQMVGSQEPPHVIRAEAMLETDVPGKRTFAIQVRDDSMQPLFSEGEVIFVNPDLPPDPDHYVVVDHEGGGPTKALLRQLKETGGQTILHPLNRRYDDLRMTKQHRIVGRVVRLRKNV